MLLFFFSSRRRHTRCYRDWSSDVCSSDLEVVKGVVVHINQDFVMVDVGYKSEGRIHIGEFLDENGQLTVKVGDDVRVLFERAENEHGYIVLSKKKAESQATWSKIEEAG